MSFGEWQLEPSQAVLVVALGVAYSLRVRTLAAKGRPIAAARRLAFYGGLLVAALALVSPIDYIGEHRLLWVHMVQHLLLGDLAPLLVVLGTTGAVLRPLLAIRPLRSLRALGHPLVALPIWIVDLYVWHLPALYEAALRHSDVHALEHFCFFSCGVMMWSAVVEPLPGPVWFGYGWKAVYTLAVRTAGAVLANVFIWDNQPLYAYYEAVQRGTGISTVSDQRTAGAIMFIEGSVVTLLAFAWLFMRFTRELEIRQRLVDQHLDEATAMRAARYGRSARVRDVMH